MYNGISYDHRIYKNRIYKNRIYKNRIYKNRIYKSQPPESDRDMPLCRRLRSHSARLALLVLSILY